MTMSPITCVEFQHIQRLLCEHCGIYLHDNQAYLVQARLSQYATRLGVRDFSELIAKLRANPEKLLPSIVNLMTTNETWWFRETSCWNALEKRILPDFIDQLSQQPIAFIRIWIAGCSAGQEAYSLAMLIDELCVSLQQPLLSRRFAIEAMDISQTALSIARHAIYTPAEMRRGLSQTRQDLYFTPIEGNYWQLTHPVRQRVQFKAINLARDFSHLGRYDLIMCRNVTIYFTQAVRQQVLLSMRQMLNPAGILLIGNSELWEKKEAFTLQEFEGCVYVQIS